MKYYHVCLPPLSLVAPFAGAWIEIVIGWECGVPVAVAPFAGAWIEILLNTKTRPHLSVAPFAGAWIEISDKAKKWFLVAVAPFAGAWIEMYCHQKYILRSRSLPSRERGLKSADGVP